MDKDGFITITDRQKELIKTLGFQVAPAELEAVLVTHPGVLDSCVIGVPDEKTGELPRAYVVLKPDAVGSVSEKDVADFVESKVATYKRLGGGVVFCDSIPKTASGKILRREVVAMDRAAAAA
jgi:acyl-CoA synthetase (AMP-forming)/AMP-acid ligase II